MHPGALRAALRSIPGLFCVTDSTAATGMPDGEYRLGSHLVTKCMGGVRLPDGTLAGKKLELLRAVVPRATRIGMLSPDDPNLRPQVTEVQKNCGGCHQTYRVRRS